VLYFAPSRQLVHDPCRLCVGSRERRAVPRSAPTFGWDVCPARSRWH